jgi:hypothetical protein
MPTFEITGPDGKTYEVDGPDASGAYNALSTMLAPKGEQFGPPTRGQMRSEAVSKEIDASPGAKGTSLSGRALQGATFGFADEALAALTTPLEMIKRKTWDPVEGYAWAKERENQLLERSRKNTGALGDVAEFGGGFLSGSNLARAGYSFMPGPTASLGRRAAGAAADSAIFGGISGIGAGEGVSDSAEKGVTGAAIGGLIGGALPVVGAAASTIASPVTSAISARVNPERFAQRKIAEAVMDSGRNPTDMASAIRAAADEGQGAYRLADEMGVEGRNLLATTTNAPGRARETVADFLTSRNVDAPRRLQGALQEASGTPQTAAQMRAAMESTRAAEAQAGYAPVKTDPTAFDPTPAVTLANRSISPVADNIATAQQALPTDLAFRKPIEAAESQIRDPIRTAVAEARAYLASPDLTVSNVNQAFRAKTNIDQMIKDATEKGQGGKVAELVPIANALDEQLARVSKPYASARNRYQERSKEIEAIDAGAKAAKGGRMEDTIPAFQGLNEYERMGFRSGYFDDLITKLQQVTPGPTNDASRGLRSVSLDAEIPAFATPGTGELTARRIGREATMAKTNARALGGSRTSENMNNDAAMGADPTIIANLLGGNYQSAGTAALRRAANGLTGNTPAVRENVARLLLGGDDVTPLLGKSIASIEERNLMLGQLLRGVVGGGSVVSHPKSRR